MIIKLRFLTNMYIMEKLSKAGRANKTWKNHLRRLKSLMNKQTNKGPRWEPGGNLDQTWMRKVGIEAVGSGKILLSVGKFC